DIAAGTDRVVFPKDPQWGFQALSFTPDSRGLYVVGQAMGREEVEPATFYEVSLSGGPPQRMATQVNSAVGWSADVKQKAFVRTVTTSTLVMADRSASNEQTLAVLTAPKHFVGLKWAGKPTNRPSWSPDGRRIALAGLSRAEPASSFIAVVNVADRSVREIGR